VNTDDRYLYSAWFQDDSLSPGEQDHQWPACIIISGGSSEQALRWGDHLAQSYALRTARCVFLHSSVSPPTGDCQSLPRVAVGQEASDDALGW
jgi:hypothetical protein